MANNDSFEKLMVVFPDHILGQEVDGELVLLDTKGGGYYGLNEVGSKIWSLLREGKSLADVLASLLNEYDVSEEQLRSDMAQFLSAMNSQNLLQVKNVEDPENSEA